MDCNTRKNYYNCSEFTVNSLQQLSVIRIPHSNTTIQHFPPLDGVIIIIPIPPESTNYSRFIYPKQVNFPLPNAAGKAKISNSYNVKSAQDGRYPPPTLHWARDVNEVSSLAAMTQCILGNRCANCRLLILTKTFHVNQKAVT